MGTGTGAGAGAGAGAGVDTFIGTGVGVAGTLGMSESSCETNSSLRNENATLSVTPVKATSVVI